MAIINLQGRLGGDPTIEQNKKGENYMRFTVAEDSKTSDGQDETRWFTIIIRDEYVYGRGACKYLKKGSSVNIVGEYKDELYQKKDGSFTIVRTIYAAIVNFVIGSRSNSDSNSATQSYVSTGTQEKVAEYQPAVRVQTQNVQQQTPTATATTTTSSAATIRPKSKQTVPEEQVPTVQASDDDELPF